MEEKRQNRISLINQIEKKRNSKVLCYLTGDRLGFETRIASDIYSLLYEHLIQERHRERIDLFIYSVGGLTIAAWGIVNLIRQFTDEFNVIIPFKALSSATLISLGANNILMSRNAQLSPIDPSVNTPFNPTIPIPQGQPSQQQPPRLNLLPISVEEVLGYYFLANKYFHIEKEEHIAEIFKTLTEHVHPLALGSVYRAREQIRILAKKLLSFHINTDEEKEKVENIINKLTYELYSHDYFISPREAKHELKLKVQEMDGEIETLCWELFKEYSEQMELNVPFNPEVLLGNNISGRGTFKRAYLESSLMTHLFVTDKEFKRIELYNQPNMPVQKGFQETLLYEGWKLYK